MNRVVYATCGLVWAIGLIVLVACAVRVSPTPAPPPAVPPIVFPSPSIVITTPFPASPVPTRQPTLTPTRLPAPPPTPRAREFETVTDRDLLVALFPELKLTPLAASFRVNDAPDWMMWVNSAVEGRFTQTHTQELAAIIANDAPGISPDLTRRVAPWGSFLAIFQKRANQLHAVHRAFLFPTALAPHAFIVSIDAVTDFDHDGQDELLVTTTSQHLGIMTTAGFLYAWNDQTFVQIWSAPLAEDNTAAVNQPEYFSIESRVEFADLDGNGMDEIIVERTRIEFARDAQGLANIDQELERQSERRVYRWGGAEFVLDPAQTTPFPTRTP